MTDKLCFLVCENLRCEVEAAVRAENFADVDVVVFPGDCDLHRVRPEALKEIIGDCKQRYSQIHLLGGCCLSGGQFQELDQYRCPKVEQCFDLLYPSDQIRGYASAGAYLLTPGWLERWEEHLSTWGFDEASARKFFQESASRLVLLDTGTGADTVGHLDRFASVVGLPFEVVPASPEFLRLQLRASILEHSHVNKRGRAGQPDNRQASEYAMALDLVGNLTRTVTEKEAIESVLDLFANLFAPGRLIYLMVRDGQPSDTVARSADPIDNDTPRRLAAVAPGYALIESGTGFVVSIGEPDNIVGVLEVDDLAFPAHREHYLNLAITLAKVCGMAVTNARTYEKLVEARACVQHERDKAVQYLVTAKQRTAELEAANRELEAFSYSVSHDLRSPLRSLDGFSSALLEDYSGQMDEQGRQYLRSIQESSQLMGRLIDDLLNLSRVTRSQMTREEVNLSEIANKIVSELKKSAGQRSVNVVIEPDMKAYGDRGLLRIVLQNLLGNAWKFTAKCGSPRIEMGTIDHGGKQVYFIRDNGVGFDMTYADKLFKPFHRLHGVAEFEGTGIGLATVQRIVRRHGGEVWAEGVVGKGATVYFTLDSVERRDLTEAAVGARGRNEASYEGDAGQLGAAGGATS